MHIYTLGEQEIGFRYFFNPYYFRTSVKTTFKGISGLPCPIAMRFLSSESTFQALHLIMKFAALKTMLKVEKQS